MFVDENGVLHHIGPKIGTKRVIKCPHCNVETMAARTREFYKAIGNGVPGVLDCEIDKTHILIVAVPKPNATPTGADDLVVTVC